MSFPALSCEFATLDVSDALGTKRLNLTKTVRKVPITLDLERAGAAYEDAHDARAKPGPKYDDEDEWWDHVNVTEPLDHISFMETLNRCVAGCVWRGVGGGGLCVVCEWGGGALALARGSDGG